MISSSWWWFTSWAIYLSCWSCGLMKLYPLLMCWHVTSDGLSHWAIKVTHLGDLHERWIASRFCGCCHSIILSLFPSWALCKAMQSGFSFVLLELCYSCSVAVVFYWCGCFCVVFFSTKPFLDGKIVPKVTSFVEEFTTPTPFLVFPWNALAQAVNWGFWPIIFSPIKARGCTLDHI